MSEPRRIWWPLPGRLCVLERPGGGGRSHRPERREADLAYLEEHGVRVVISTMKTRHGLDEYEERGFEWEHIPVPDIEVDGKAALPKVVAALERALVGNDGIVALHGNRQTDFVAAAAIAFMREHHAGRPKALLEEAARAGLRPTPAAAKLVGVRSWSDQPPSQPRSAIAASTSSGRSVMT
jgi:hypothetical protein